MSNTTKKKIISLEVRDEYILGSGVAIGAQGSFDSSVLRVKFDDNWLGLNIYATWTDALGNVGDQTIVTVLDLVDGEANTYDIPVSAFATQYAGTVKLALSGYVIGGEAGAEVESLLNTVSGAFRVLESSATPLDGGKTAASVADQLLAAQNDFETYMKGRLDDHKEEIDSAMAAHKEEVEKRAEEHEIRVDSALRYYRNQVSGMDSQEKLRQNNETKRINAELGRVDAEAQRKAAETARVANENARDAEEERRIANENARLEVTDTLKEALANLITLQEQYIAKGATV